MRDYAKKSHHANKPSESDGTWILAVLIVCTILFVGYVTYHFSNEKKLRATLHPAAKPVAHLQAHAHLTKPEKEKKIAAINPADAQPKYDFYRILPATTVTIPKKDLPANPSSLKNQLPAPT